MSECKKCRSLFLEAYYKELDAQQNRFFKEHILVCEKCKSEFDKMADTLQVMDKRVRPEPSEKFWDSYEERLAKRVEKEEVLQADQPSLGERLARPFILAPKWAYQAAAALVLIVVGVFIGRMIFSPSISGIQRASQQPGLITQQQPEGELIHRTQNYIERSKLILLALVNFDPATEDPYALNIPYQQQLSRNLVQEASTLKKDLAESDQRRLEELIANLEMILLQIANLEYENDFESIELVKEGMDRQGILMEINLTDLRHSFQERSESRSLKQPSTKPQTF
ncbi:MAG: hypothetical protein KAU47_06250 [Candidatus Aminicenantes bacterium]|nr:hypothetical protein [Candidatus Aminicenantes bacterium]